MTPADEYRAKATEFAARARRESEAALRLEYEALARGYLRLADQAECNSHVDIVYETPPSAPRAAQQQQQQIQPKKTDR
jgi:hypothetical protein